MNETRRIRISLLVFRIHSARLGYWAVMARVISILAKVGIWIAQRTRRRGLEELKENVAHWVKRADSIIPELQAFDHLTDGRKKQLLAARSALLEEKDHLQVMASKLQSYRSPGVAMLIPTVEYMQSKLISIRRQTDSFSRIVSKIDSDTFYWDLLLWLVVPGANSEPLMGDLNEEYLLRNSTEGEAGARAWYRAQVAATLRDYLWKKIERLTAIGTLIDLVCRWFRS